MDDAKRAFQAMVDEIAVGPGRILINRKIHRAEQRLCETFTPEQWRLFLAYEDAVIQGDSDTLWKLFRRTRVRSLGVCS